jgi:hypothetical protein
MIFGSKLLILLIIIIVIYIVYRLILKRRQIILKQNRVEPQFSESFTEKNSESFTEKNSESFKYIFFNYNEGFSIVPYDFTSWFMSATPESELNIMKSYLSNNTQIIQTKNTKYKLNQYCIKGSYNSACTGKFVSADTVSYLISRGVRYLDFEIYNIPDPSKKTISLPFVAVSSNPNSTTALDTNYIYLKDVLTAIHTTAFNSSGCANSNDPLFINLRIKTSSLDLYNIIATMLTTEFANKLYFKKNSSNNNMAIPVNENTNLQDIMGKVIICLDISINPKYATNTSCEQSSTNCINLQNLININTGGSDWTTQTFSTILSETTNPPVINYNDYTVSYPQTTSINIDPSKNNISFPLNLAIPDNTNYPSDDHYTHTLIKNYGVQTIAFPYYNLSNSLILYENIFESDKTAITLMSSALLYVKTYSRPIVNMPPNVNR